MYLTGMRGGSCGRNHLILKSPLLHWLWHLTQKFLDFLLLIKSLPEFIQIRDSSCYLLHFIHVDIQFSKPRLQFLLQYHTSDLETSNSDLKENKQLMAAKKHGTDYPLPDTVDTTKTHLSSRNH